MIASGENRTWRGANSDSPSWGREGSLERELDK